MKRFILRVGILLVVVLLAYLLTWPVPINPAAWTPPPAPELTGQYAQNSELTRIQKLPVNAFGPEDVAIDGQDRLYCGTGDGQIFRLQPDGTRPEVFANTHGRPLGLIFDHDRNLIVADAIKGLLSITADGTVTTLSTEADRVPFRCTNDLDVAADGTIYFTDASYKFPLTQLKADVLEHQPNGRFLAYDPRTRQTRVFIKRFVFRQWRGCQSGPIFRAGERHQLVSSAPVLVEWAETGTVGCLHRQFARFSRRYFLERERYFLAGFGKPARPGSGLPAPASLFAKDSLAAAFISATEYQALRVRARARHER
jgi:hypothetical protein